MRTPLGAVIFIAVLLLIDAYAFQAVRSVSLTASHKTKTIVNIAYWSLTALTIIAFLVLVINRVDYFPRVVRNYIFAIVVGIFLAKLCVVFFTLIDDIRRLFQWIVLKIAYSSNRLDTAQTEPISRSVFLNWLGLAAGGTLFGSLIHGFSNKYNYHVNRLQVSFPNLPAGFKGLKILQISDIHSGSFTDPKAVHHGIEKILNEKADIILFTGDLVNDMASEMEDYIEMFSKLAAPMGVYSTLGNHDYGPYIRWPQNGMSQDENLEYLKKIHAAMGWRLLLNEHVPLERNGDKIALIGIENWSAKKTFSRYGRLDLAHKGTEAYPFKILMSHDPSHWDAQVRTGFPDIDLTLSGHTHGMQFGVDIPGFKWSPVQYMYKQWAGLYESEKQKLYVNRGFGFIGYPGRVGILPEITVIELV